VSAVKIRSDGWLAPSSVAGYGLGTAATVRAFGETEAMRQRRAEIEAAISEVQAKVTAKRARSQVTALSSAFKEEVLPSKSERQLADLLRYRIVHHASGREVLAKADQRRRKYEIETGIGRDGTIHAPLEPWTAPGSRWSSMFFYGRIMHAEPGTYSLDQLSRAELEQAHWMAAEGLVLVDEDMRIHPLSDAAASKGRMYPGAPGSDKTAAIGLYLRDNATGLVAAALWNLSVHRGEKGGAELVGADGVRAKVAQICAEANRIKAKRPGLAEYRYLSVTRCAEIVRALIDGGFLDEIEPVRFERRFRSWRAVSRALRVIDEPWTDEDIALMVMFVAAWDAERRKEATERRQAA